jgi:hypothetical protein
LRYCGVRKAGSDAETHSILIRAGATDGLVEGNTFINVGEPVTLAEGSTATVRGNRTEKRWF